jgi:hypothetical protein
MPSSARRSRETYANLADQDLVGWLVGCGLLGCRSLKPPLPGFIGHAGECRDRDGGYGTRLEHNGAINLDDCGAMCVKQVNQRIFCGPASSPRLTGMRRSGCTIRGTSVTPMTGATARGAGSGVVHLPLRTTPPAMGSLGRGRQALAPPRIFQSARQMNRRATRATIAQA